MQRISFQNLNDEFFRVLIKFGFIPERAKLCAQIFSENTLDGVHSHGLNRFPDFIERIQRGRIDVNAIPKMACNLGVLEQWDGQMGPGPLNAHFCMDRAITLSREHGIGCVGLKNTNHWMRGGAFGLQAADSGCIGICWTNTTKLMPAWGSAEIKVGNNPLVFSIPRFEGHILLDMAMSQFSNGKLDIFLERGKKLPVPGGYDSNGNLSNDPLGIQKAIRPLPIGYWKGVGLALVLDLVVTLLSGGQSTYRIACQGEEYGVSQVFIAIDVKNLVEEEFFKQLIAETVQDLKVSELLRGFDEVRYPGEGMLRTRRENLEKGILVNPVYWKKVLEL